MSLQVDFDVCNRELLSRTNAYGSSEYRRWTQRPDTAPEVVPFVHGFVHSHLFKLSMSDFEAVVQTSEHALGDVQSQEQLRAVEDFTCPFAFQHLFHDYIESHRSLPTWQDFSAWLKRDAYSRYVGPLLAQLGRRFDKTELARAVRWRLGKAYYSAMREIELLTRLREQYGIALRYHLLADVLLRTDFWIDNVLICVWFENPRYRSEQMGRKHPAAGYFEGSDYPFNILDIKIERQGYGKFWRVSDSSVERIAREIQQVRNDQE